MFELPAHSGHGRVWLQTLERLRTRAEITIGRLDPDVWLIDGHNGDPGLPGRVLSCVYEIGWGTPELDEDHDAEFISRITRGTDDAVRRSDRIVTGSKSSQQDIARTYGFDGDKVDVVPFGVDHSVFRPEAAQLPYPDLLPSDGAPYILFASSLHPRKNLRILRDAVVRLAERGFPHRLVLVAAPFPGRPDSKLIEEEAYSELPGFPGRLSRVEDPSDPQLAFLLARAAAVCQPKIGRAHV